MPEKIGAQKMANQTEAAPLIRQRKIGTRYDPAGAIKPPFGTPAKTIKPEESAKPKKLMADNRGEQVDVFA